MIRIIIILMLFFIKMLDSKSLWKDDGSLFKDNKAGKVGDIITVLVQENAIAKQQNSTSRSKGVGLSGGPEFNNEKPGKNNLLGFMNNIGIEGKSNYSGIGSNQRSGILSTKLSARITKVLPNGNLFVEGNRTVKINNEDQVISLKGEIRSQDITSDNTILSTYISNAEIKYRGDLEITDDDKSGIFTSILTKVLNFIW